MNKFMAIMLSTSVNRNGTVFSMGSLVAGLKQSFLEGMPYFIGHDHHRLIGWATPLSVCLKPDLGRLTALVEMPENSEEEHLVERAYEAKIKNEIDNVVAPAREELNQKLGQFIVGEVDEVAPQCAAYLQPGLARRTFNAIFDQEDKDGLISVRLLKRKGLGVFEIDGLLLFAHQYFRRSLSRFNTTNEPIFSRLSELIEGTNLDIRIALDPDMVGLARTYQERGELQYWYGPHFSQNISDIAVGVTRHESTDEDRVLSGVTRMEFGWYDQKGDRIFECEELRDIPTFSDDKNNFGCRFVHSIAATDKKSIIHADGAIRMYDEKGMAHRLEVDLKRASRKTIYTKIWRIDGKLPIATWKRILSDYYRDNVLVGEYFDGKDEIIEEFRNSQKEERAAPSQLTQKIWRIAKHGGVNLSVSYRPKAQGEAEPRILHSFDSLQNKQSKYRYFESDAVEVVKILKRRGCSISLEEDLVPVLFEDQIVNFPIFSHGGSNSAGLANETIGAIIHLLERFDELKIKKLVSFNIEVAYGEVAVLFSFAGRGDRLVNWFSNDVARIPDNIESMPGWCERALAILSKEFKDPSTSDCLLENLKTSGVLKFDRAYIPPDMLEMEDRNGESVISVKLPEGDDEFLNSKNVGLGKVVVIKASKCALCGNDYEACNHSKYFDDNVRQNLTSIDPMAFFFREIFDE